MNTCHPRGSINMNAGSNAQLRGLECELSLLNRADGSARVVQGNTSVLSAVYGPAEVKIAKEQCNKATLDVVIKPESGLSSPKERQLEQFICSCCQNVVLTELHPHTAISIVLQVESNAGAVLSSMVHACCLALLDACVPLSSVFTALTCCYTEDGKLIADPDVDQEKECKSLLTFAVDELSGDMIASHAEGEFSLEQLQQAMGVAQEASKSIADFYRQSIKRKLSKDAKFGKLQDVDI